ncbi:MAG: XrtV sorting system accessory protein [Amphiplicatus sp.]
MLSVFDIYSVGLLIISLIVFVIRYVRQDPPIVPYLVIACVCAVGNWLGEMGGGWAAMSLLIAASFLFLSCLLAPHRARWRKEAEERQAAENAQRAS